MVTEFPERRKRSAGVNIGLGARWILKIRHRWVKENIFLIRIHSGRSRSCGVWGRVGGKQNVLVRIRTAIRVIFLLCAKLITMLPGIQHGYAV
ncbi:hypothetical protein CEXT_595391 [Caerostris extrusa]|uniref:Uncharacterized protein n=1 Tax=Caerostris extrusa TaxID=172846 RepID=A0AAV4RVA4_CAEEX|nr:hypothetical protein CEXT_595391 [Caerostris extrusa]